MKALCPVRYLAAIVVLVLASADFSHAQIVGTGVLLEDSPVFLFPDPTRQPLTTLAKGVAVTVLDRQGDWLHIRFRDARFGDRYGYVLAARVSIDPASSIPPGASSPQGGRRPQPPAPGTRPAPRRAATRTPRAPVTVTFSGGVQTTSRAFTTESTFQRNAETGILKSQYSGERPIVLDAGVHTEVWRGLTTGIAATWISKGLGGSVTVDIPHPFFFDRPRTVTGNSSAVTRDEIAVHFYLGWSIPITSTTRASVFGGPTHFRVTQGLVTDVTADEVYPYDVATFSSATTSETTQTKWGYNVGFDLTQRVWRSVGVGFMGRFSRAPFTFPIVGDHDADINAGGLHVGGGLRVQF